MNTGKWVVIFALNVLMTLIDLKVMSNPWTNAYNHPKFVGFTKEEIDEMLMCELEEIYNYE
mgnify:CR=1 FL=1|tara:strand:- start:121 stop:303 length:183 start_codon:yes stop_codon:yes gene_type:complete